MPKKPQKHGTPDAYVYGRHTCMSHLRYSEASISEVIVTPETLGSPFGETLRALLTERKLKAAKMGRRELSDYVGHDNHQGIVLKLSEGFSYSDFEDILGKMTDRHFRPILFLDRVQDPRNLGAIIRSACAFDFAAVVIQKDRATEVTAVTLKTAAGTASLIPICRVTNLGRAMDLAKEAGFWFVGADGTGVNLDQQEKFPSPVALIIGSEGEGIRQKLKERCDFLVRIPMAECVESLNASVAAAILCYELRKASSDFVTIEN